jgi:hypothetical protein
MRKRFIFLVLTSTLLTAQADCPSWPTSERFSFTFNGAEVIDKRTGLTWKRCSEGQTWSDSTCIGTATAHTHVAALTLTKAVNTSQSTTGWRLPNVKELASLADRGCQSPAIDRTAFPATPNKAFWSSTPFQGEPFPGVVYFGAGQVDLSFTSESHHVRLVRTSQ